MAQREQVRRLLGGLDAGDPGDGEHVALADRAGGDLRGRLGLHDHPAAGDGAAVRRLLGRDVHHPGPPERVEVRELGGGHDRECKG